MLDCLSPQTMTIVLPWQVSETQMSPNQKEVARKRLALHVYDEKLAQYFIETLICFRLTTWHFVIQMLYICIWIFIFSN
jgi:hypothetical protein